ncbi:hypothetical protein [Arthrobacter sp. zg-Y1143]|uniref:hypothetical protein n=1 Tax=Arthrobacter sp. zg-Y1143 TaxID=3049065 RepID=UPI0024C2A873|nr:hypothetical protein [Arthrobacter sp. zg-Y1143]MDK1326059.1 hypothetical protein [Arthrobacter sp. zg-Y1143]
MSEHPDDQDARYIRGLLTEAGVEESPELLAGLLSLRAQAHTAAPEPSGKLAALLDGAPVPLKSKHRRGIILSTALIGAMAAGATGVAATQDFLVRADPAPVVSFTPEPAPTAERSTTELVVPEETFAPVAAESVPSTPENVAPAPEPVPDPAPVPMPAPAAPVEAVPAPPVQHAPGYPGSGKDAGKNPGTFDGPPTGYIPGQNRRNDGGVRDTMGPGGGAAAMFNGGQSGNGAHNSNGRGHNGQGNNGYGWPGGGR